MRRGVVSGRKGAGGAAVGGRWAATRSSTQDAESRASASWSQHSSIVSLITDRPCEVTNKLRIIRMGFLDLLSLHG